MSTRTLRDPRRSQHGQEVTTLRVAADPSSDLVHLASFADGIPSQQSLCGRPIGRHDPGRLLHEARCLACVGVALELGATCAEDRHGALVNLRRLYAGSAVPLAGGAVS